MKITCCAVNHMYYRLKHALLKLYANGLFGQEGHHSDIVIMLAFSFLAGSCSSLEDISW